MGSLHAHLRELCYRRSCSMAGEAVSHLGLAALSAACANLGSGGAMPLTATRHLLLASCLDELKLCARPATQQQRLDFAALLGQVRVVWADGRGSAEYLRVI